MTRTCPLCTAEIRDWHTYCDWCRAHASRNLADRLYALRHLDFAGWEEYIEIIIQRRARMPRARSAAA